ncbi:MAG: PAS domain-containing sensor histidine kinase [Desulfobulbus propionicus]|nr:MAG: PAS domain-containing sensor histidine kinase [Desulfobulbus propionicus]
MASSSRRPTLLIPVRDTDQQLAYHILWLLVIRVTLFCLLIGLTLVIRRAGLEVILPPLFFTLCFLLLIFGFSIGSAFILQRHRQRLKRFGGIQLLSDVFFTAVLVYATGCSQSIFTPVFIFPVIAGGLILYRIGGLMPAAAATILYGLLLVLEYYNILPGYFAATPYIHPENYLYSSSLFAVYGLTFFLVALLSAMLSRRLRSTEEQLSHTVLQYDRLSLLYKQIFDNIPTGIITTNQEDRITSFNHAAERITGYLVDAVAGRPLAELFPEIRLDLNNRRNVCDLKKQEGDIIRAGYSISELKMPEATSGAPIEEANCKVITLQDISKIEQMERQVREAEKMAAIGELSASIAHDFRNPLAAISGSAQLLSLEKGETIDDATLEVTSSIIVRESKRMAKTITDFLQFARPAAIQAEWFDLARMVDEVVTSLPSPCCTRIQVDIAANIDAWGDRQQLQTVFRHVLENACTFAKNPKDKVHLQARESDQDENLLVVKVIDAGPGIAPATKEHIFAPFFSTRESGTGLGLAIVHQIIDAHGGQVEVINLQPQGCEVRLLLPGPEAAVSLTPP